MTLIHDKCGPGWTTLGSVTGRFCLNNEFLYIKSTLQKSQ